MEDRDDDYEYESLEGGNMMPMPDTLDWDRPYECRNLHL